MRFELAVCLRYLAPKRGRLFVSISTLFSILGLALGVTTYITVIAVMTGFRNQITSAYTGYYSDLIAYKEKVERGRRVFAIVTERDLLRSIAEGQDPDAELVGDHLTAELVLAEPDWSLEEAAVAMVRGGFRHLVVVEGGETVGVLSVRDIVRCWTDDGAICEVPAPAAASRVRGR